MGSISQKVAYFFWAAAHQFGDSSCPACGREPKSTVKRKYAVTKLVECECGLRYRLPKMSADQSNHFYQSDYSQGFTTDCPSHDELERLKANRFADTEKDYSSYIEVLQYVGITAPQTILDFGCSWGYGSWQLSQAGYSVHSYEVSKPRAEFARKKLGCHILESAENPPEKVDCLFSAHVIEHLPNPAYVWELAKKVLKTSGKIVTFMPNGDATENPAYHKGWGLVHPTLLTRKALISMARSHGFEGRAYSSPYDLRADSPLTGKELLFICEPRPL
jgi:SAM-dependent methyltransferase